MYVPVFAQAAIDKINHPRRNGEAQTFTASALRQDEGVDAEDGTIHIHQRASAVAGIDGSVGLQIGERLRGIRLAGERADDSHRHGILQTFWTADGEYELPHMCS